jgi:hypothetical protein
MTLCKCDTNATVGMFFQLAEVEERTRKSEFLFVENSDPHFLKRRLWGLLGATSRCFEFSLLL